MSSSAKNQEFGENLLGRSCIVLSELLLKASPEINPQVRDEAMKLASDWKSKITAATENRFAAFGLLYFIASYRFGPTVDEMSFTVFLMLSV